MASITINIDGVYNPMSPSEKGELRQAMTNIAGIIESAIENAFGSEHAAMYGNLSVNFDVEDWEDGGDHE